VDSARPSIDTLVIGAGQAGLAASYWLTEAGVDHQVLDSGRVAESWRTRRWDSFTLVTPNWMTLLPGFPEPAGGADAFLARDDLVASLADWAAGFGAPVREGVRVSRLSRPGAGLFRAETPDGPIDARRVIVATGYYRRPRWPPFAAAVSPAVLQLDATEYRRPDLLPPGAVLVVGSGQSGCQIAEELQLAGREVWFSIGTTGRLPRRYRGRDGMAWFARLGIFDLPEERFPDPRGRLASNPHCSGARGGHSINLHRLARAGVHLVGRLAGLDDGAGLRLRVARDLAASLRAADGYRARITGMIDLLIEREGLDSTAPDDADDEPAALDGFRVPPAELLDLDGLGIRSIVWSCGYLPDLSWLDVPVLDGSGYPIHRAGLAAVPGLGFVGLRFQRAARSDLLYGVADDARIVVERLTDRRLPAPAAPPPP
jgi:putative flavoprotein involved in K+ transport